MTTPPLTAHSLTEASLYLLLQRCPSCGHGPLRNQSPGASTTDPPGVILTGSCHSCGTTTDYRFHLSGAEPTSASPAHTFNPTVEPSQILDIADWLTLARMLADAAEREADRPKSRQLRVEAGLCLDEALKFFDDDNDLPPDSAFFTESSRSHLRRTPQLFSRQRLISLRMNMPRPLGSSP